MTDQLPLEVCRRIVEHLQPIYDNATLLSLALASHALHTLTTPILYNSLYLLGPRPLPLLLATLTSSPTLASHPGTVYIQTSTPTRPAQTYWTHLASLLHRIAPTLEHLIINAPHDPDASWVLRSLHAVPGPLSFLRVPFWWDAELVAFLESPGAQALTRLETADVPPPGQPHPARTLAARALPLLGAVEAPPEVLCALVPGRPVTHVRLRLGMAVTFAVLLALPPARYLVGECLVRSTAPGGVVALDVGDLTHGNRKETYSMEVLEHATRFLPNLQFMARVTFPWTKDVPVSRLHRPLIRLPYLRVLEVVITGMRPQTDHYWELATASELRTFSPSLREIVFWKGFERHRWVWLDDEADFVWAPEAESYPAWGGV